MYQRTHFKASHHKVVWGVWIWRCTHY